MAFSFKKEKKRTVGYIVGMRELTSQCNVLKHDIEKKRRGRRCSYKLSEEIPLVFV